LDGLLQRRYSTLQQPFSHALSRPVRADKKGGQFSTPRQQTIAVPMRAYTEF